MAYSNEVTNRGVYVVREGQHIMYVGSSKCALHTLEYNHRNWYRKYGEEGRTHFRSELLNEGKGWTFDWLVEPFKCDAETIEHIEGSLIRQLTPKLNRDMNPVASSKRYGRY